jgi:hypothetical protein
MRFVTRSAVALSVITSIAVAACGDDTSGSGGEGGDSGTTTTSSSTKASTGATTSSSAASTTTSSSAATTGSGGGVEADHLIINEVVVAPVGAELIEIHNPTAAAVDLDDYYLSDNSTYHTVASGDPWDPITNNAGTDFAARFPAGTSIPAGGYLVVGFDPGYEAAWGGCPDLFVATAPVACGGNMIANMEETAAGSITDMSGLSDSREMVVLFSWSGDTDDTLLDVDYVTWGATFEDGTRADKTGVAGYQADTAPDMQQAAAEPPPTNSIERCGPEIGETQSGGNGSTGHDETSEDMSASFAVEAAATPGVANVCP